MGYEKNLQQIVNLTLRLASDYRGDYKNGRYFTVNETIAAIKEACLDLVITTGCLKKVSMIVLSEDTQTYTMPADCLWPIQFMLNGREGVLILPKQRSQFDYERLPISDSGDPVNFYRDSGLAWNQIGFVPNPGQDGSGAAEDLGTGGILRRISDGTNDLTFDANRPLRRIRGAPIDMAGPDGRVIRGVGSTSGNIVVHYVRAPEIMNLPNDTPDPDLPLWVHKDLKWGALRFLLRGSRIPLHLFKGERAVTKWEILKNRLKDKTEHTGPLMGTRPA